jgi:aldose 1-epimerase
LTEVVTIARGGWIAEIAPGVGGALVSLVHDGVAVLRSTPEAVLRAGEVNGMACYPLVPYANRIGKRRFRFAGAEHILAANFPGSPHTLHGVGWRRAWRVDASDARSCTLGLEHRARDGGAEDWRFDFDARQRFELDDHGLTVTVSMTNVENTDAPAGIGLHAFFPRRSGQRLAFNALGALLNGPDMLPSSQVSGGDWDFSQGRRVGEAALDNDFLGWDGSAVLSAEAGPRVLMRAGPAFSVLRVYTPPNADFLAVEPVSHRADAINHPEDRDGAMTVLAPGATLEGEVRFSIDPLL